MPHNVSMIKKKNEKNIENGIQIMNKKKTKLFLIVAIAVVEHLFHSVPASFFRMPLHKTILNCCRFFFCMSFVCGTLFCTVLLCCIAIAFLEWYTCILTKLMLIAALFVLCVQPLTTVMFLAGA